MTWFTDSVDKCSIQFCTIQMPHLQLHPQVCLSPEYHSFLHTSFVTLNRALYDGRIWPLFWQWWHVAFLNLHDSDRSCILPHDLHLSGLLLLCSTLHPEMACWTFAALQLAESLMCTIFAFLANFICNIVVMCRRIGQISHWQEMTLGCGHFQV